MALSERDTRVLRRIPQRLHKTNKQTAVWGLRCWLRAQNSKINRTCSNEALGVDWRALEASRMRGELTYESGSARFWSSELWGFRAVLTLTLGRFQESGFREFSLLTHAVFYVQGRKD